MGMKVLSQKNPRWGELFIGKTALKIRDYGCTLTCMSMLHYRMCRFFGGNWLNPEQIAKAKDCFNSQGQILWNKVADLLNLEFLGRERSSVNHVEIQKALNTIEEDVILEVDTGFPTKHWVWPRRKLPFSNHYMIYDPIDGKLKTTFSYKGIIGVARFRKKK